MPKTHAQFGNALLLAHPGLVNIHRCHINDGRKIGPFLEIHEDGAMGAWCKVSSGFFITEGGAIEDDGSISRGDMFGNELFLRATTTADGLQTGADWTGVPTRLRRRASIDPIAAIASAAMVGRFSLVGAGVVVPDDVPAATAMIGNQARPYDQTERFGFAEPSPIGSVA